MKRALSAILPAVVMLLGCAAGLPASAPEARTAKKAVYVTRHMQKLGGDDPSLSAEGNAGAERLADALADKGVAAIFATATRRAMETAAPLSLRTGVPITAYDPRNPQALIAAAATSPGAILVVGHSNTVHDLVARFGGRTPPAPLTENDYGAVFVISETGGVDVFEVGE